MLIVSYVHVVSICAVQNVDVFCSCFLQSYACCFYLYQKKPLNWNILEQKYFILRSFMLSRVIGILERKTPKK